MLENHTTALNKTHSVEISICCREYCYPTAILSISCYDSLIVKPSTHLQSAQGEIYASYY